MPKEPKLPKSRETANMPLVVFWIFHGGIKLFTVPHAMRFLIARHFKGRCFESFRIQKLSLWTMNRAVTQPLGTDKIIWSHNQTRKLLTSFTLNQQNCSVVLPQQFPMPRYLPMALARSYCPWRPISSCQAELCEAGRTQMLVSQCHLQKEGEERKRRIRLMDTTSDV